MKEQLDKLNLKDDDILVLRGNWNQKKLEMLRKGVSETFPNKKILCLVLEDGQSVDSISEEQMRGCGWIRSGARSPENHEPLARSVSSFCPAG